MLLDANERINNLTVSVNLFVGFFLRPLASINEIKKLVS